MLQKCYLLQKNVCKNRPHTLYIVQTSTPLLLDLKPLNMYDCNFFYTFFGSCVLLRRITWRHLSPAKKPMVLKFREFLVIVHTSITQVNFTIWTVCDRLFVDAGVTPQGVVIRSQHFRFRYSSSDFSHCIEYWTTTVPTVKMIVDVWRSAAILLTHTTASGWRLNIQVITWHPSSISWLTIMNLSCL